MKYNVNGEVKSVSVVDLDYRRLLKDKVKCYEKDKKELEEKQKAFLGVLIQLYDARMISLVHIQKLKGFLNEMNNCPDVLLSGINCASQNIEKIRKLSEVSREDGVMKDKVSLLSATEGADDSLINALTVLGGGAIMASGITARTLAAGLIPVVGGALAGVSILGGTFLRRKQNIEKIKMLDEKLEKINEAITELTYRIDIAHQILSRTKSFNEKVVLPPDILNKDSFDALSPENQANLFSAVDSAKCLGKLSKEVVIYGNHGK